LKKLLLTGAMLALMAVAAEAQIGIQYTRQTSNSTLSISYSSGVGYGYGFGYGYGYGYGPYGFSQTSYSAGIFGASGGYSIVSGGPGLGDSSWVGGYSPYSGMGGGYNYNRHRFRRPFLGSDFTLPVAPSGMPDSSGELPSVMEIEEGRRRFRTGDYRGAVDLFRQAVVLDGSSGLAQAWFSVGLAVMGDYRNAEKALRAAADRAPFGALHLRDAFRDDKERSRVVGQLTKVSGEGSLSAAFVLWLVGEPERLKALAEKDPSAKKLVGN
jgi:hypothetical protein